MSYPFWCCKITMNTPWKPFCGWLCMFNALLSMCNIDSCTTHGQNRTRGFDTEGYLLVASLFGLVDFTYWFTKFLIGKTENMWWVVYINANFMYSSKTNVYTIIACLIVRNVCRITSTWPLVIWFSVAFNVSCNPRTQRPSLNPCRKTMYQRQFGFAPNTTSQMYLILQIWFEKF